MPERLFGRLPGPLLSLPHRWLVSAIDALLPSPCALCGGAGDDVVCSACRAAYAGRRVARCGCCGNPLAAAHAPSPSLALDPSFPLDPSLPRRREPKYAPQPRAQHLDARLRGDDGGGANDGEGADVICGACLSAPPAFDATVAAVDYAAPLDQLVLRLKFGACLPLAPWCARLMRDAALARPGLALPDLLLPVPLGAARLAERGFNQALEIARPLAAALGVALHPRLAMRTLETSAQSGVAPRDRARNVRGAFGLQAPELVAGRHVGLVDDVMTSGHTLAELAAVCKNFGAVRVTNFVFARTPPQA